MLKKVKEYMNDCKPITAYTSSDVETIALVFIAIFYALALMLKYALLTITCPLWLAPYCIYKARKQRRE